MRQIATLPVDLAHKFADYLLTLKIETHLDQDGPGVALWVCDEDQVPRARQELADFNSNPADPRYGRAAPVARAIRREEEQSEQQQQQQAGAHEEEPEPGGQERPLTIALIAGSVVVSLVTNFGHDSPAILDSLRIAPLSSTEGPLAAVLSGEVWRLITPIFIHLSVLHLVFNMMMLISLAGRIEILRGPGRLLFLVVVTAALSNLGEYYFDWSLDTGLVYGPKSNFGGMSGVLYGLFGYMWMKGKFEPELGLGLPPDTVVILLGWFVLCLAGVMDTSTTRVANVAHAVGLVVGVVLGIVPSLMRRRRRGDST
jgi:GlpG protein